MYIIDQKWLEQVNCNLLCILVENIIFRGIFEKQTETRFSRHCESEDLQ